MQRNAAVARQADQQVGRRARIGPFQKHWIGSYPEHQFLEASGPMRKIINSTYISIDGVDRGAAPVAVAGGVPVTSASGRSRWSWPCPATRS